MSDMTTKVYPEHLVSAYILSKVKSGEKNINAEEVASAIPELMKVNGVRLMRMSYRGTAIGKYSPEIRGYFAFLDDVNHSFARSESSAIILSKGIEHAQEVMSEFRKESPSAANELERIFSKVT